MSTEDEGEPGSVTPKKKKAAKKKKAKRAKKAVKSKASGGTAKFPRHSVEKALRIPRAIIDRTLGMNAQKPRAQRLSELATMAPIGSR
jgi:hypothetical protein